MDKTDIIVKQTRRVRCYITNPWKFIGVVVVDVAVAIVVGVGAFYRSVRLVGKNNLIAVVQTNIYSNKKLALELWSTLWIPCINYLLIKPRILIVKEKIVERQNYKMHFSDFSDTCCIYVVQRPNSCENLQKHTEKPCSVVKQ